MGSDIPIRLKDCPAKRRAPVHARGRFRIRKQAADCPGQARVCRIRAPCCCPVGCSANTIPSMCPTSLEGPESSLPAAREGRTVAVPRPHQAEALSAVARAERLGEEGVALRVREAGWAAMWAEVLDFRNSTGRWPTNSRAVSAEQQRLGRWVHHQRILARRSQLEADRMATLNGAGFVWNPPVGRPAKNPQATRASGRSARG